MPTTQIDYTIEEGGKWHSAEIRHNSESFEEALELYSSQMRAEVQPDRRVPIELEGGNILGAAAIRLPNDRVFDAILGCFRNEKEKIRQLKPSVDVDRDWDEVGRRVRAYLEGEGPDPIEENDQTVAVIGDGLSMEEQRMTQVAQAEARRHAKKREAAMREAFEVLHQRGVIETHPDDIPRHAPNGLQEYADRLPDDVYSLIASGRLTSLVQHAPHCPPHLYERGWIILDEDPEKEKHEIPPENAIASWEIKALSVRE